MVTAQCNSGDNDGVLWWPTHVLVPRPKRWWHAPVPHLVLAVDESGGDGAHPCPVSSSPLMKVAVVAASAPSSRGTEPEALALPVGAAEVALTMQR